MGYTDEGTYREAFDWPFLESITLPVKWLRLGAGGEQKGSQILIQLQQKQNSKFTDHFFLSTFPLPR